MYEKFIDYTLKHLPTLETERLILRKMSKIDSADMYEYASREDVTEFLTWTPHESLRYTKKYLNFISKKYKTGEFLDWGVVIKGENKLIGTCGFTSVDIVNLKCEIGYVINPCYSHKGFGEESVRAVINYAFDTLELNRIEARVIEGNVRSVKLLEKCGFFYEGKAIDDIYSKKSFKTVLHFALLKKDRTL